MHGTVETHSEKMQQSFTLFGAQFFRVHNTQDAPHAACTAHIQTICRVQATLALWQVNPRLSAHRRGVRREGTEEAVHALSVRSR